MPDKPDYKNILIISTREAFQKDLTYMLTKHLEGLKFTFLDLATDQLPDEHFDSSGVDLMLIDLTEHKRDIHDWFAPAGTSERLPPAIFFGSPAKFKDAGFFFRAGAADYLDLQGLDDTQLLQSLVAVSMWVKAKRSAAKGDSKPSEEIELLETGEIPLLSMQELRRRYEKVKEESDDHGTEILRNALTGNNSD